ncbi:DUF2290 domain-containing protein [Pseudoalteromonas arctica]|uniref:DUF2290 domain-containing protein n=1 Tax=Pseudoalteromonas arctica TaxID=394751 RepID=A0AAP7CKW6_9GAMM|nr:DUF2290 domain-containing protein [Pseudoalteromonas arctica]NMP04849.1 DUF2290 domain-containing protein [Pseudoalteromonas arctica]
MNKSFSHSINKCIECIAEINYLFQAGTINSLNASKEFKYKSRRAVYYREIYEAGTENQDFNLMLKDLSYFQFTENTKDKDVRLAFYPNPFQFIEYQNQKKEALELFNDKYLSENEYEQVLSEGDFICDIPLIRYDLSVDQHCDNYHPAAHFHIGFNPDNRWPVGRKLTPYAFMLKVLMLYYPKLWFKFGDQGAGQQNTLDISYRDELKNCELIDDMYFKEFEKERLNFM